MNQPETSQNIPEYMEGYLAMRRVAHDLFPKLFPLSFKGERVLPLSERCQEELLEALAEKMPETSTSLLSHYLMLWRCEDSVLLAHRQGGPAYGLDGAELGTVSDDWQWGAKTRIEVSLSGTVRRSRHDGLDDEVIMAGLSHEGMVADILWSRPDQVYHGKIANTDDLVTFEGDTPEEVLDAFVAAVEDYKRDMVPSAE